MGSGLCLLSAPMGVRMKVLFSPLPEPKSRWTLFFGSYSLQGLALLAVINLNLLYPATFELPPRVMITNLVPFEPPQEKTKKKGMDFPPTTQ